MVHAGSGVQPGQGLHGAVTIPGKTGLKAADSPASSPRRNHHSFIIILARRIIIGNKFYTLKNGASRVFW